MWILYLELRSLGKIIPIVSGANIINGKLKPKIMWEENVFNPTSEIGIRFVPSQSFEKPTNAAAQWMLGNVGWCPVI